MDKKTIKRSIDINADKDQVWNVLTADRHTRAWYAAFSPGSYAETDWKAGSTVYYKDSSGNGLISEIKESRPGEIISVEHKAAIVNDRREDSHEESRAWAGSWETYRIEPNGSGVKLTIVQDTPQKYYDFFIKAWDEALQTIKKLAESR